MGMVMGVMILNQILKGLFRREGEEWSLSGTVNSFLASSVSTKGVVLRKGNTGECNYTHSCFYQTLHSLVEMVIGDARKLDKCLCQFLLSPCASFKWFFTHEFKKHWGVYLDWLQYTKHLIGSAQNQPTANWKDIYWDRLGMPQRNFNNTVSRGSKIQFRYPLVIQSTQPIKWDQTGEG